MSPAAEVRPYQDNYEHLEHELQALDLLIRLKSRTLFFQNQTATEKQAPAGGPYIAPAEVNQLLENSGAQSDDAESKAVRVTLQSVRAEIDERVARTLRAGIFLALPQLRGLFGLSVFEQRVLIICLAPELKRKYDRLYAYLQDDIVRQRPSVDLALELLCDTERERWSARNLLLDGATLLRAGLIVKVDDTQSPSGSSGLSQLLKLDSRIHEFLLGSDKIDNRLRGHANVCRAEEPTPARICEPAEVAVWSLIRHHLAPGNNDERKLVIALTGPNGVGKTGLVLSVCRRLRVPVLTLDLELLLAQGAEAGELIRIALRESLLQQAVPHFKRAESMAQPAARPLLMVLGEAIAEYGWLVFLSGDAPWTLRDAFPACLFQTVKIPVPDVPRRVLAWEQCLTDRTPEASDWAAHLARRFRLTPGQIRAALQHAENHRRMQPDATPLTLSGVSAACRQQCNHKLAELACKIEPHCGWDDIVLSADKLTHLHEICDHVRHNYTVFGAWGFGRRLSHGKGLSVLFTGPSGTGKTMAAEVLANELELDLYKVDLSGVVSKYIGETEKNLSRIFEEAETSNAILFFDEADALFGKRTSVSEARDRYANIETSYLLQKMESYEGAVILATNLRENMDDAFTRRIRFIIDFPFPDETSRRRIWQAHFPKEAPLSPEIDYDYLAREFQVAGGNIKNIVLHAAFTAAANCGNEGHTGTIGMSEILQGTRRELAKMGKFWNGQHAGKAH